MQVDDSTPGYRALIGDSSLVADSHIRHCCLAPLIPLAMTSSASTSAPHQSVEFPTSTAPRSWGEALQAYQQQKHSAPALTHGPPSRHLPLSHPSHRSFDPFVPSPTASTSNEPTRQSAPPSTSTYNLIAPTPLPPPASSAASSSQHWSERGERGYDLISCHPLYPDSASVLGQRDAEQRAREVRQGRVKVGKEQRDWDVVGNRYKGEAAEEKRREEEEQTRTDLIRRYWQQHHYNPVVGEFYSSELEVEWRRRKTEAQAAWGQQRDGPRRQHVRHQPAEGLLRHEGQEK